jgi:hypothetical protein
MDEQLMALKFIFVDMWEKEMESWWKINLSLLIDVLPKPLSTVDAKAVSELVREYILKGIREDMLKRISK